MLLGFDVRNIIRLTHVTLLIGNDIVRSTKYMETNGLNCVL